MIKITFEVRLIALKIRVPKKQKIINNLNKKNFVNENKKQNTLPIKKKI